MMNANFLTPPITGKPPRKANRGFTLIELFVILGIIVIAVALLLPATRRAPRAARRNQCINNLKQIALAICNYEATYGVLPPAYTVDADGKRLHSWRTLILPFLEEKALYERIDLSKAWDDPANSEALNTVVAAYVCPEATWDKNHTIYFAVAARDGCLGPQPRRLSEITDGLDRTLLVVEVDPKHAAPWISPTDADEQLLLSLNPQMELAHPGIMNAARADGGVFSIRPDLSVAQWRALMSIAGDDNDVAASIEPP